MSAVPPASARANEDRCCSSEAVAQCNSLTFPAGFGLVLDGLDRWLWRLHRWADARPWTRYAGQPPLWALVVAIWVPAFHWVAVAALAVVAPLLVAQERERVVRARMARRVGQPLAAYVALAAGTVAWALAVGEKVWMLAADAVVVSGVTLILLVGFHRRLPTAHAEP